MSILNGLTIVSGTFHIISLIYLNLTIEDISDNHKIYLSSRTFILHFI